MNPIVWFSSYEIANAIHIVVASRNPLIRSITTIDNRPEILRFNFVDNFKICPVSFETDSTPNIVKLRVRVRIGFEILVKRVFVKNAVGGQIIHCLAAMPAIDKFLRTMASDKNHVGCKPLRQFDGASVQWKNHTFDECVFATQQFVGNKHSEIVRQGN